MIARTIKPSLRNALFKGKAIIIYGARQVGKTTLMQEIEREIDYLDESGGTLNGWEIKWNKGRLRVPSTFSAAYPECAVSLVNRDNLLEFVGVLPNS